jgi:DNA-binding NarL/FixJ family response regulator
VNKTINILVVEPSPLILEGLAAILNKSGLKCRISIADTLEEMEQQLAKANFELVVINPIYLQNNAKGFHASKIQAVKTNWIGLIYSFFDPKTLAPFDALISISDSPEAILCTINKLLFDENQHPQSSSQEVLSEREIDVLKLLATGMANKEIADKLNISVNTVITHRKNISQKTGIKSVSGLTIYAVVQKLIIIDAFSE